MSALSLQSPPKEIRIEPYILKLIQTEERVTIELRPANGRDVDDSDVEWLTSYLGDLGKWEKLLSGFQTVLNNIMGLHQTVPKRRAYDYDIQAKAESYAYVLASVGMPYKMKKQLREHGQDVKVLVSDVISELANVPNWRALITSWSFLKEQILNPPSESKA